jgi:hypothetical protein
MLRKEAAEFVKATEQQEAQDEFCDAVFGRGFVWGFIAGAVGAGIMAIVAIEFWWSK